MDRPPQNLIGGRHIDVNDGQKLPRNSSIPNAEIADRFDFDSFTLVYLRNPLHSIESMMEQRVRAGAVPRPDALVGLMKKRYLNLDKAAVEKLPTLPRKRH